MTDSTRIKGKLIRWDDDKGFGFISPMLGGNEVFLHIKDLNNASRRPLVNDVITFMPTTDKQGRQKAIKATLSGDKLNSLKNTRTKNPKDNNDNAPQSDTLTFLFILMFLGGLVGAAILKMLPFGLIGVYLSLSLLAFIAYAIDKSAAKRGKWRTKESSLHIIALMGGWPGALFAQKTLRHKSIKQPFKSVFWITVVVNCVVLSYLIYSGMAMTMFV